MGLFEASLREVTRHNVKLSRQVETLSMKQFGAMLRDDGGAGGSAGGNRAVAKKLVENLAKYPAARGAALPAVGTGGEAISG